MPYLRHVRRHEIVQQRLYGAQLAVEYGLRLQRAQQETNRHGDLSAGEGSRSG